MKRMLIAIAVGLMTGLASQAAEKPVKVFILAGQSNMEGHGKVDEGRNPDFDPQKPGSQPETEGGLGSLRYMVKNPATAAKYKHLVDAEGKWVVRDDAWIYSTTAGTKKGKLSVGFGANGVWIGPEFGFGMVVADHCKDPILIIKTAWGGKSLGVDFRPPSSGKSKFGGNPDDEGKYYREMIRIVKDVCQNLGTNFPELAGSKVELAGFGWDQGWNDGCDAGMVAEYDKNMANFIRDVRKDLNAPKLPFVIADTGQLGEKTRGDMAKLCEIQLSFGDPAKHPEFAGTVASVGTRGFARSVEQSPSSFDYHWNHNGESHYLIGEAMGKAMLELLKSGEKQAINETQTRNREMNRPETHRILKAGSGTRIPEKLDLPADFKPKESEFGDESKFMGIAQLRGRTLDVCNGVKAIYVASAPKGRFPGDPLMPDDLVIGVNGEPLHGDSVAQFRAAVARSQAAADGKLTLVRWRKGVVETQSIVFPKESIPDLTRGETNGVDRKSTYNLGPTGLRGWIYTKPETGLDSQQGRTTARSRQILVTHVGTNTPASGVIEVNDVILGVGDALFNDDARKSFGRAITEAEKPKNKGVMKLTIFRSGETSKVELKLRVLGAYSDTAPYDCPKSELILAEATRILEKEPLKKNWAGAISGLALLATGDKAVLPKVQEFARSIQPGELNPDTCGTWDWGYTGLFLDEYYLATGDKEVLPAVREYAVGLARAQYTHGSFGHRGAMRTKEGKFHGPPINGYGPIHAAGLIANMAIVLGKKCGVEDPEIAPAIERASRFFNYYVNKGGIPYGEHAPWMNHENNGKCSMAAVFFGLQGDQAEAAKFFARMATAGYANREYGHTGQGFSYLWGVMGANVGGPAAAAAFVKEAQWHLDLVRRCDGSFTYDGGEQYGAGQTHDNTYWGRSGYDDLSPTACYVLSYAVPLKKLHITGKGASKSSWLDRSEVKETIAAGRFDLDRQAMGTPELLKAFNNWSPVVRLWAAEELAARPEAKALAPELLKLAEGPQPNARGPACAVLGALKDTNAIPVLVRLLRNEDRGLRYAAADALGAMGGAARPVLPELLQILADTAEPTQPINWEDPIQFAHGKLSEVVFGGLLHGSLEGCDRNLLYSAFRAVARNPDSHTRAGLRRAIQRHLTEDDVRVLAPDIIKAIEEMSPADIMWADDIRTGGLDLLSRLRIREGMALCVSSMEPRWGNEWEVRLQYLLRYGVHAREVLPQLKAKIKEDERNASLVNKYIAQIEASKDVPPIISLKDFMAGKSAGGDDANSPGKAAQ